MVPAGGSCAGRHRKARCHVVQDHPHRSRFTPVLLLAFVGLAGCASGVNVGVVGSAGSTDESAPPSAQLASIDTVAAAGRTTTTVTISAPSTAAPTTAQPVTWRPPSIPLTIAGMESYLQRVLGCDSIADVSMEVTPNAFACQHSSPVDVDGYDAIYVLPLAEQADIDAGLVPGTPSHNVDALWDAYGVAWGFRDKGKVDGGPITTEYGDGCWIVASAGPWSLSYTEHNLRPGAGSEMFDLIEDLDAVVHEDCGQPELAPDTITLVDQIGGYPTCQPVEVAASAAAPTANDGLVDWADYDTAFTCTNGYSMVRVPPGTVDSFRTWSAGQLGCRPYVAVGRWVIHQSATTVMPADYDQSVLIGIGMTYGTNVVNPCTP